MIPWTEESTLIAELEEALYGCLEADTAGIVWQKPDVVVEGLLWARELRVNWEDTL